MVPVTLVSGIVFNGYVSAKDRMTGKPVRPLLISTHATREPLAGGGRRLPPRRRSAPGCGAGGGEPLLHGWPPCETLRPVLPTAH